MNSEGGDPIQADKTQILQTEILQSAVRDGVLSEVDADRLTRAADSSGKSAVTLAAESDGGLERVQVEILTTLANPCSIAPGYEILELIARGGMGIVYLARQLNLDRKVALKILPLSEFGDQAAQQRFEREAKAIGRLRHASIVTAYDFGQHGPRYYLALEYVEGVNLERWIAENSPLSERIVWALARQVAAGLAHASQNGVIHRDMKPANLLLLAASEETGSASAVPTVKIADFGIALLSRDNASRLTAANTSVGSPNYMAPEQFEQQDHGPAADIYGLGATIYHMLAGRPPFADQNLAQMIGQKIQGPPPSLADVRSDVSDETILLVMDMMEPELSRRIADYSKLFERIDALPDFPEQLAGGTDMVVRNTRTSRTSHSSTRVQASPKTAVERPWMLSLFLLAALAILAVAAVAIVLIVTNAEPNVPVEPRPAASSGMPAANDAATSTLDGSRAREGEVD